MQLPRVCEADETLGARHRRKVRGRFTQLRPPPRIPSTSDAQWPASAKRRAEAKPAGHHEGVETGVKCYHALWWRHCTGGYTRSWATTVSTLGHEMAIGLEERVGVPAKDEVSRARGDGRKLASGSDTNGDRTTRGGPGRVREATDRPDTSPPRPAPPTSCRLRRRVPSTSRCRTQRSPGRLSAGSMVPDDGAAWGRVRPPELGGRHPEAGVPGPRLRDPRRRRA